MTLIDSYHVPEYSKGFIYIVFLIFKILYEVGTIIIISNSQMRKQRSRAVRLSHLAKLTQLVK